MIVMRASTPIAGSREVFIDQRGTSRVLRLSWHPEHRVIVFSLWGGDTCLASFRLTAADLPRLLHALTTGLVESLPNAPPPASRCEAISRPAPGAPPAAALRTGTRAATGRALDGVIEACTRLRTRLSPP